MFGLGPAPQGSEGLHEILSVQPGETLLSVLKDGEPPYSIFCPREIKNFIFPCMKALDLEYCRGRDHCCSRNGTLKGSHVPSLAALSWRAAKCSDDSS